MDTFDNITPPEPSDAGRVIPPMPPVPGPELPMPPKVDPHPVPPMAAPAESTPPAAGQVPQFRPPEPLTDGPAHLSGAEEGAVPPPVPPVPPMPPEAAPPAEPGIQPPAQPDPVPPAQPAQPRRRTSPYAGGPYIPQADPGPAYTYRPSPTRPPKAPKPAKAKSGGVPVWQRLVSAILVFLLVVISCSITASSVQKAMENRMGQMEQEQQALMDQIAALQQESQTPPTQAPEAAPAAGDLLTPSQLYDRCVDSVVAVSAVVQSNSFYGPTEGSSSGSGFIFREDGYIATNYHVVEGATSITVLLHDETEYTAQLVGHDATNDLAILKVEADRLLPAVTLGSSSSLAIGDMVVAIGNPLGTLSATQTVGYISGVNRIVNTDSSSMYMLQTDAAINPGNSGGPLFDMYGQVVGITTAKYSGTTNSGASIEGIGFAIPIDDVMGTFDDLIDFGYVTGAYLGITVTETDKDAAALFDIPTGAYVVEVLEGYCAQMAGIQPKDVIIALGDTSIRNPNDLTRALRALEPGDETTITVNRGGSQITMDITLDERPADLEPTATYPAPEEGMPSEGDYDEWFNWFFGG